MPAFFAWGDAIGFAGLSGFPSLTLRLMAKGRRESRVFLFLCRPAADCTAREGEGDRPREEREFIRIFLFVFWGSGSEAARVGLGSPTPTTSEGGTSVPPGLDKTHHRCPRLYAHPPKPPNLPPFPFYEYPLLPTTSILYPLLSLLAP